MKNAKKGFTLVELLVVIAIIAILATVSIVSYVSIKFSFSQLPLRAIPRGSSFFKQ